MSGVLKLSDVCPEKILIGKKFKKLSDDQKIIPCKFTRSALYVQTPPIRLLSGVSNGFITFADQTELFNIVLQTDEHITGKLKSKWPDVFGCIDSVYKSPISIGSDRQLNMRASISPGANVYSSGTETKLTDLSAGMIVILLLKIDGILLHKGVITTSWDIAQVKLYSPPKKRVIKLQELSIVEESEAESVYDSTAEMLPYYDETGEPIHDGDPEEPEESHDPGESCEGDASFVVSDDGALDNENENDLDSVSEDESPDKSHIVLV